MATRTQLDRLESLTWVFLYGGLLALVLGLAAHRLDETAGWSLIVGGAVVAAVGVAMIWLRSHLKEDDAANAQGLARNAGKPGDPK